MMRLNLIYLLICFLGASIMGNSPYGGKKYSPNDVLSIEEQKLKSKEIYSNLQIDDQHLGEKISLDFVFTNTQSNAFKLADFFGELPVILSFVYFNCPRFCNLVLNAKKEALKGIKSLKLGKDYKALTVSIDPRDTITRAIDYQQRYNESFKENQLTNSTDLFSAELGTWNFLLGNSNDVKSLANQVGFPYRFSVRTGEYEHPAGIFILSPTGKICQYFYGVGYNSFDLRLALAEAKLEKERTTVEKILLFCYSYNFSQKGYSLQAMKIMRLGGVLTILFLFVLIFKLYYSEKKKKAV